MRTPGYRDIVVEVYKHGALFYTATQPLTYSASVAPFSLGITIDAELADYDFRLLSPNCNGCA